MAQAPPPVFTTIATEENFRVVAPTRELANALNDAREYARDRQWSAVAKQLQTVFQQPEDFFLDGDFRTSVKREALALLASLPEEGRLAYETQVGFAARGALRDAPLAGNRELLETIARQAPRTQAGYEAIDRLACQLLDSGSALAARQLLEPLSTDPVASAVLGEKLAIHLAFANALLAGPERSVIQLETLRLNGTKGFRLAGKETNFPTDPEAWPQWLFRNHFRAIASRQPQSLDWDSPGGSTTRTHSVPVATAAGGVVWNRLLDQGITLSGDLAFNTIAQADLLRQRLIIEAEMAASERLTIPAAQPLVIGNHVICRTLSDIAAYDLATGEERWRSAMVDPTMESLFAQNLGLAADDETDSGAPAEVNSGLRDYLQQRIYRDSLAGQLSSDGRQVFAIEELGFNGLPYSVVPDRPRNNAMETTLPNRLISIDAESGRLLWELGDRSPGTARELASVFFLGPPLAIDGQLHVLAEVQGEIRLFVLSPDPAAGNRRIEWSQALVAPTITFQQGPVRRLAGLIPSAAEGILVCPTAAGAVVAIDLTRRLLLWGYKYSTAAVRNSATSASIRPGGRGVDDDDERWLDSSPVISDGMVIVTPRDSSEIHCLDLTTGELRWTQPRGSRIAIAGVLGGRLFLLRQNGIEAVQLSTGAPVWPAPCLLPPVTGRGILSGELYHVPVGTNEISTIDLSTGRVLISLPVIPARPSSEAAVDREAGGDITASVGSNLPEATYRPGNLAVGQGRLVSMNGGAVQAFADPRTFTRTGANLAGANPADAKQSGATMLLEGEFRLSQGDIDGGLALIDRALPRLTAPQQLRAEQLGFDARMRALDAVANHANPGAELSGINFAALRDLATDPAKRRRLAETEWRIQKLRGNWGAAAEILAESYQLAALDAEANINPPSPTRITQLPVMTDGYRATSQTQIVGRLLEAWRKAGTAHRGQVETTIANLLANPTLPRTWRESLGLAWMPQAANETLPPSATAANLSNRTAWQAGTRLLVDLSAGASPPATLFEWLEDPQPVLASVAQNSLLTFAEARQSPAVAQLVLDRMGLLAPGGAPPAQATRIRSTPWMQHPPEPPFWQTMVPGEVRRVARPVDSSQSQIPIEIIGQAGPLFRNWAFRLQANGTSLRAFSPAGELLWDVPLIEAEENAALMMARLTGGNFGHSIHIAGTRIVLSMGALLWVFETHAEQKAPQILWTRLLTKDVEDRVVVRRAILPNMRRVVLATDQAARPARYVAGITSDRLILASAQSVEAIDFLTGETAWRRTNLADVSEVSVGSGAVVVFGAAAPAGTLAQNTGDRSRSKAWLLDPLTGDTQATHDVPQFVERVRAQRNHLLAWYPVAGTAPAPNGPPEREGTRPAYELRLVDLAKTGGEPVWVRPFPAETRIAVVQGLEQGLEGPATHFAALTPEGGCSVHEFATGRELWSQQLTGIAGSALFLVRETPSGYVAVVGNGTKLGTEVTVRGSSDNAVTMDAKVLGLDGATGNPLWTVPVERMGFDITQPTAWPFLLFTSRSQNPARQLNGRIVSDAQFQIALIDRNSGRLLYFTREPGGADGPFVNIVPTTKQIHFNFFGFTLELPFEAAPTAPPPPEPK